MDRSVVAASDLDRVVELLGAAEQARAEAAVLLGGLADSGLARWLGYVSVERLVAHRTGSGNRAARELVQVARHLEAFPATAGALLGRRISWAGAEVLARAAEHRHDAYAADESELLDAATGREPEEVERICRLWRARVDPDGTADDAAEVFARRGLWMQFAFDGSCNGRFTLDATGAEAIWAAVDTPPDPAHTLPEPRTGAQRRADKLVSVCEHSLGESASNGGRAAVDVVIDVHTLAGHDGPLEQIRAELDHGGPITGPGLDRLLCDASLRALITDGPRTVLAYNRATPDIPPGLRRAVRVRDKTCAFTGCDRPWICCEYGRQGGQPEFGFAERRLHHIIPRNRGGPTTAENLTLLCRFHHTCVHEGGWQLTRAPDGNIDINSP